MILRRRARRHGAVLLFGRLIAVERQQQPAVALGQRGAGGLRAPDLRRARQEDQHVAGRTAATLQRGGHLLFERRGGVRRVFDLRAGIAGLRSASRARRQKFAPRARHRAWPTSPPAADRAARCAAGGAARPARDRLPGGAREIRRAPRWPRVERRVRKQPRVSTPSVRKRSRVAGRRPLRSAPGIPRFRPGSPRSAATKRAARRAARRRGSSTSTSRVEIEQRRRNARGLPAPGGASITRLFDSRSFRTISGIEESMGSCT